MAEKDTGKKWYQREFGHDVFFIAIISFFLGLLVALDIWGLQRAVKDYNAYSPQAKTISPPAETKSPTLNSFTLKILTPPDEDTVNQKTITVLGSTSKPATVVVDSGSDETILESNNSFSTQVLLSEGYNEITVTAFDSDGNQVTETRKVIYTTQTI